jgi:hypothetical protein
MGNQAPCVQSNTQDLDFNSNNSEKYYVRNSEFEAMHIMRGVDRRETLGIIDRSAAVILDQSDSDQENHLQERTNSDQEDLASYHSD